MPWTPLTLYGGRVDTVIELEGLRRRSSSARPRTSPFLGRTVVEAGVYLTLVSLALLLGAAGMFRVRDVT